MDPMLLMTLIGGTGTLGIGVVALRKAWSANKRAKRMNAWLQEQELEADGANSWTGEYDERWLQLRIWPDCYELALRFWPELGLGLRVYSSRNIKLSGLAKGLEQAVLHESAWHQSPRSTSKEGPRWIDIEKDIHGSARKPSYVRELFNSPVCKRFRRAAEVCDALRVTDAQLFMRLPFTATPEEVGQALRRASRLMNALDKARQEMGVPEALEPLVAPWEHLAEDNGLTMRRVPLSLAGLVKGRQVMASTTDNPFHGAGAYALDITVWFTKPLGEPFELKPMAGTHKTFESAFRCITAPPAACLGQLDGAVQHQMLRLLNEGALTLNARYLWLRCPQLPEPDDIVPLMHRVAELAGNIEDCVHAQPTVTGYRRTARSLAKSA